MTTGTDDDAERGRAHRTTGRTQQNTATAPPDTNALEQARRSSTPEALTIIDPIEAPVRWRLLWDGMDVV
ncbi:MAG: hypothetical protein AAFP68_17515 [Pseudomonadota bacterium]